MSKPTANDPQASRYLIYKRNPEDCGDIADEMALLERQLREAALLNRTAVVGHLQLRGGDGRCADKAPHELVAIDQCRLHGPGQPEDGAALQWVLRADTGDIDESAAKIIDSACDHRIDEKDNDADVLIRDLNDASLDALHCFEDPHRHRVRMPIAADIEALAHRVIAELQGLDEANVHSPYSGIRPPLSAPDKWEAALSHVWVDLRQRPNSAFAARRCLKKIASLVPKCRIPFYVRLDGYAAGATHRAATLLGRHYDIRTRDDFEELQPYLDRGDASKCQPWIIDCVEFLIMSHACIMFHSQKWMRHDFSLLGPEAYLPKWRIAFARGQLFAKRVLKRLAIALKTKR